MSNLISKHSGSLVFLRSGIEQAPQMESSENMISSMERMGVPYCIETPDKVILLLSSN